MRGNNNCYIYICIYVYGDFSPFSIYVYMYVCILYYIFNAYTYKRHIII